MKTCRSCHYWLTTGEEIDRIDPETNGLKAEKGSCRRFAPQPYTTPLDPSGQAPQMISRWPPAASDDGCGQWEPRID